MVQDHKSRPKSPKRAPIRFHISARLSSDFGAFRARIVKTAMTAVHTMVSGIRSQTHEKNDQFAKGADFGTQVERWRRGKLLEGGKATSEFQGAAPLSDAF